MPVFATAAGGVADLRPFFPNTLRPFPPPSHPSPAPITEDLRRYYETFTWKNIAERYEDQVLGLIH